MEMNLENNLCMTLSYFRREWPLSYSIKITCLFQPLLVQKKVYGMHYIKFLLTQSTRQRLRKIKVWINFSPWIFFYIIDLPINLKITTEWECAFLNTAIIIFCFIYSLNIPHSNENPSFFPVEHSVSISSKFAFRQRFTISATGLEPTTT